MATKITKSELKEMIREALREELKADYVLKEEAVNAMDWDELIAAADGVLEQLIQVSGNTDYDDGDGYWEEENVTWCNRFLYYSSELKNTAKLKKLCDQYSNKLPNVSFYFVEREDDFDPISEIGYTAERNKEKPVAAHRVRDTKTTQWCSVVTEDDDTQMFVGTKDECREFITHFPVLKDRLIIKDYAIVPVQVS